MIGWLVDFMACHSLLGYLMLMAVFFFLASNYMISSNYSNFIIIIICLYTVLWFQVSLCNTNNFHTDLFEPKMGTWQVLRFRVRELEHYPWMQFSDIPRTLYAFIEYHLLYNLLYFNFFLQFLKNKMCFIFKIKVKYFFICFLQKHIFWFRYSFK